jgi:hypothetical protein
VPGASAGTVTAVTTRVGSWQCGHGSLKRGQQTTRLAGRQGGRS